MMDPIAEQVARQQIKERLARASAPRVRSRQRHTLADRLRRVAGRLEA